MIICVCNALNEKELKRACADCPRFAQGEEVLSRLGRTPQCGQCLCFIEDVMLPSVAAQKPL